MRKFLDAFARGGASCRKPAFGLLALAALSAAAVPASLAAQAATSEERNLTVAYQPGNAQQNGYADAQLRMTYRFQECLGGAGLVISIERRPHMLVGAHRYWVDGQLVQVPQEISPPELSAPPTIRGTVRGQGMSREVSHGWPAINGNATCAHNGIAAAAAQDLWERGATTERKAAALRGLSFQPSGDRPPLRNSRVEDHFRALWRQARADSVARVQAAERAEREQRERAEREAREREEAERRAEAERQREAEEAARAADPQRSESSGASGSGGSGAPMSPEEARRAEEQRRLDEQRSAEEAARAEEARRQEEARRAAEEMRREFEEEQRRQQAQEDAMVSAATGGAQAAMNAGLGFGGYYFNISGLDWEEKFLSLNGFGMGFDADFMYLDVGILTGTYSQEFQETYESDGYSTLDDLAITGYFGNAGFMAMMPMGDGNALGLSAGMLYAVTPETDMYAPVGGFIMRLGGFKFRFDAGFGDQMHMGGAVYFDLGG